MFPILFGLSMDYEVFLVSRIYEEWHRRRDNTEAVAHGLAATGRTITAAAAIMVLVFASFILGGERIIELFGVGLASAVLLDALIVRSVLVPALMIIIGDANWKIPSWLDWRCPASTSRAAAPPPAGITPPPRRSPRPVEKTCGRPRQVRGRPRLSWSAPANQGGDHYWPGGAGATAASPAPVSAWSRLTIPRHGAVGSASAGSATSSRSRAVASQRRRLAAVRASRTACDAVVSMCDAATAMSTPKTARTTIRCTSYLHGEHPAHLAWLPPRHRPRGHRTT